MISSDDIFDYLLDLRSINDNVNRRKHKLGKEHFKTKYNDTLDASLDQYELLKIR